MDVKVAYIAKKGRLFVVYTKNDDVLSREKINDDRCRDSSLMKPRY